MSVPLLIDELEVNFGLLRPELLPNDDSNIPELSEGLSLRPLSASFLIPPFPAYEPVPPDSLPKSSIIPSERLPETRDFLSGLLLPPNASSRPPDIIFSRGML